MSNIGKKRKLTTAVSPETKRLTDVRKIVLRGAAKVTIEEDGRIETSDAVSVDHEEIDDVIVYTLTIESNEIVSGTSIDGNGGGRNIVRGSIRSGGSVRIGDDTSSMCVFGGIGSISGGVGTVINSGRGAGGGITVSNGRVSFDNGAIGVSFRNNTLHIEAPQSTRVQLNRQPIGTVQRLLDGENNKRTLAADCADADNDVSSCGYSLDLDTCRIDRIHLTGASTLRINTTRLFERVDLLDLHASGSAQLEMPRETSPSAPIEKLVASLSGASKAAFYGNRFEQVAVHASGAATISSLVALSSAQVRASGAAKIHISVYARETVDERTSGVAKVYITTLDG